MRALIMQKASAPHFLSGSDGQGHQFSIFLVCVCSLDT